MDVPTSVTLLERCRRLTAENAGLRQDIAKGAESDRALRQLVAQMTSKMKAQQTELERLRGKLAEEHERVHEVGDRERYAKGQVRRAVGSRQAIEMEALRLKEEAERQRKIAETAEERLAARLAEAAAAAEKREATLHGKLKRARAREAHAKSQADAARAELEELAKAPWRELRQSVEAIKAGSVHRLQSADDVLAASEARAAAAEKRAADAQQSACLLEQRLAYSEQRYDEAVSKLGDKQAKMDAMRAEFTANRAELFEARDRAHALGQELERSQQKLKDVERQLRLTIIT